MILRRLLGKLLILFVLVGVTEKKFVAAAGSAESEQARGAAAPNIHAVIVSSSRYWFNYRHVINALSIYQLLKGNGVPDSQIILMLADELPSNARNAFKNSMYVAERNHLEMHLPLLESIYDASTEVDFRGSDVTVDNFIRAVMGGTWQSAKDLPSPRTLQTDENSTILVYVTGHGGDQFFKFQDEEEITARDFSNMFDEMNRQKKYKRVLFLADTCQAFTLADKITAANVISIGSSLKDENAYAHHSNGAIGVSIIERYTYSIVQKYRNYYFNARHRNRARMTLQQLLVDPFVPVKQRNGSVKLALGAHVGVREDSSDKSLKELFVDDFFGTPSWNGKETSQSARWRNRVALEGGYDTDIRRMEEMDAIKWTKRIERSDKEQETATMVEAHGEQNESKKEHDDEPEREPSFATFAIAMIAIAIALGSSSMLW